MGAIIKIENADYSKNAVAFFDEQVGILRRRNKNMSFQSNSLLKQYQASTAYIDGFDLNKEVYNNITTLSFSFILGNITNNGYANLISFTQPNIGISLRLIKEDNYTNIYIYIQEGVNATIYKTDITINRDMIADASNTTASGTRNTIQVTYINSTLLSVKMNGENSNFYIYNTLIYTSEPHDKQLLIGGAELLESGNFWSSIAVDGLKIEINNHLVSFFDFFGEDKTQQLTDKITGKQFITTQGEPRIFKSDFYK